jgi:hypothetical protein
MVPGTIPSMIPSTYPPHSPWVVTTTLLVRLPAGHWTLQQDAWARDATLQSHMWVTHHGTHAVRQAVTDWRILVALTSQARVGCLQAGSMSSLTAGCAECLIICTSW